MATFLPIRNRPDLQDVVRSSQSTLDNMQTLLLRLDPHRQHGGIGKRLGG